MNNFIPYWIRQITDGIRNLIKWFPVIWRNRDWDNMSIFEILKFKLLQQREYLVINNRHKGINQINRDITICLNLIQRIQDEYYSCEYQEFYRGKTSLIPIGGNKYKHEEKIEFENFSGYFQKYPIQTKKLLKKYPGVEKDKMKLALYLSYVNQKRCQALLFKILNERINNWWD